MNQSFIRSNPLIRVVRPALYGVVVVLCASSLLWNSSARRNSSDSEVFFQKGGRTGSISASPNPIQVCDGTGLGATTITWTSTGTTTTEIRINSPAGTLLKRTGPSGSAATGKTVSNGTVFYLQDVSNGLPLTSANTLATVTVSLTTTGCPQPPLYEGWHDGADCNHIFGWAADRNRLNTSISVDIYDGVIFLATVPANQLRTDVGAYLGDNGLHGFDFAVPASLKNGQPHSITVKFAGTGTSLSGTPQSITCSQVSTRAPHNTTQTPWPAPSNNNIEVEDFDDWNPPKGEGHTYHDDSVGNDWGLYRPGEDVDIPGSSDVGGGYVIGNVHGGEWLEYTVNVTSSPCDIQVRVASGGPGGRFHIAFDGVDKTGPIQVPNTGSWGTWVTLTVPNVSLPLGQHIMRLAMDLNGTQQFPAVADFNYIRIVSSGGATNQPPTVSITGTSPSPPFTAPATLMVNATASDPDQGDSIANVQFKKDGINQGLPDTVAPYSVTLNSLAAGTYVMTAVATDSHGASTTSAPFTITVNSTAYTNFLLAMIDPVNRTGTPGEDLFSGNYNWSQPIVGLPGRAHLDLGLALTYNSLVWTKAGSSIKFDADNGFPAPGFRLGFPVIQPKGTGNGGAPAYLLITSSGSRIELRQTSPGVFESIDSSFLQLLESSMTLRAADGSILTYQQVSGGNFMCVGLKDRNGNFITVSYAGNRVNTITDTLGRVVRFNYPSGNLDSITQTWNGVTHTWAQFTYQTVSISPNFPGLTVIAPATIPALTRVRLADGSAYDFDYTTLGQVSTVHHYAPDGHQLAYASYTTDNSTTDCPRLTARQDFAENWNNNVATSTSYHVDPFVSGIGTSTLPDGTGLEETYQTSGFNKGLPTRSRVSSGGVTKKTTTMSWTQNDTSLTYPANPRVTETTITDDAGNLRKTSFTYTSFNLVSDVLEYAAGGTTVIRHKQTDYVMDPVYLDRRIIGLPKEQRLYEGSGTANLVSRISYDYDWGSPFLQNQGAPVQHDETGYSDAFVQGRGNMSAINRFDVNTGQSTQVQMIGYNTTGSPIFVRDAIRNVLTISYSDSFSAGVPAGLTLAYPTMILDGENFTSTTTYHYDLGVTTKTHDPKGAEMIMEYNDPAGRLTRQTYFDSLNQVSGTYTRLEYASNGTEGRAYTLLDPGVESFSAVVTDGAGRTIGTVKNLPGSVGGYSAQRFTYDVRGRLRQQSNPAEIAYTLGQSVASWTPAGDDAGPWKFSTQDYDWKGRPTTTFNTDGTSRSVTYGGCGCAGGEVVTLTDEVGRRRINTSDILGRPIKIQELRDDGTVYRTNNITYNARDQIVTTFLQRANDGPGQLTTSTYDGHGRLFTTQTPIQTAVTRYDYNIDDTIRVVTDPRGATATYTYNNRRLVTGITYTRPSGQGIPNTPAVAFSYDQAGNISQMTDGTGQITFDYDTWSRLIRETRFFNEVGGGSTPFPIVYTYNLAGQLKRVIDPFNAQIDYGYDQAGRLASVTGTPFGNAGVTQYATNMGYRAWGGLKHLNYGNNPLQLNLTYNARLQVETMQVGGIPSTPDLMNKQYAYYGDKRLKYSRDQVNNFYSRGYQYDFVGRLSQGLSGPSAPQGLSDGPYTQSFGYDRWDNLTSRNTGDSRSFVFDYGTSNSRNSSWIYDAAGNVKSDSQAPVTNFTFDAAGRQVSVSGSTTRSWAYDGAGRVAKWVENSATTFDVWSSVLGYVLTEVDASGAKQRTYVYAGRQLLAKQQHNKVFWHHVDASNASSRDSNVNGNMVRSNEIDPLGAPADFTDIPDPDPEIPEPIVSFNNLATGCLLDGVDAPCSLVMSLLGSGAAAIAPWNTTRWNPNTNKFEFFKAYADGTSGWSPLGAPNNGYGYKPPKGPPVLGNYDGNPSHKPDWGNDESDEESSSTQQQDDCHRFADMVDQIYQQTMAIQRLDINRVQAFMDKLATTFTEFPSATFGVVTGISGAVENINGNSNPPAFGSSGFRSDYFEADVVVNGRHIPSNQVRHAVGGLIAGYVGILLHDPVFGTGMNDREDPNDPVHGVPDINLNGKTVRYGNSIAGVDKGPSLIGPRIKGGMTAARELGDWIRSTLCIP
ncbi:MAG TPA: carbohydrate-binding protein [Pyrinomonadaceae bacterium]|nr:carbohydrate-binding protein [Pyrinomonadaceae bacterium]